MGIKFPTPWKTLIIKFPPPRDGKGVKCPGYARGGGGHVEASIWPIHYVNMQSNLIDSNVALHMHLTLSLSSAHVKFAVWTGHKTKHFDITISLICAPQISEWKLTCTCKWDTPGLWNIDPFRLLILKNLQADDKTQYLLQNPYMHGVFTLLVVYCIQVLKCRMICHRNSAHQCLVTKINIDS